MRFSIRPRSIFRPHSIFSIFLFVHAPYFYSSTLHISIRPHSIFLFVHAPYFYSSTLHISIRPHSIFLFVHAPYFYSSMLHISIRPHSIFLFVHAPYFYSSMLHISICPHSIFLFVHTPYFEELQCTACVSKHLHRYSSFTLCFAWFSLIRSTFLECCICIRKTPV